MKICAISDTHNLHRHFGLNPWGALPDADLLIHCGDVTTHGTKPELDAFLSWFQSLPHRNKVFVAGNHDRCLVDEWPEWSGIHYLKDSAVTIDGIRIFGSPAHRKFQDFPFGIGDEDDFAAGKCDILVTHGPAFGICDNEPQAREDHLGSRSILRFVESRKPALHLFGHVHHAATRMHVGKTVSVNCAIHPWLWKQQPKGLPVVLEFG